MSKLIKLKYLGSKKNQSKLTKEEAMKLLLDEGYDYLGKNEYDNFKNDINFIDSSSELRRLISDLNSMIFLAKEKEINKEINWEEDERSWYLTRVL